MPTLEEKINTLYAIITKQETRRKRALFFSWGWRVLFLICIGLLLAYPKYIVNLILERAGDTIQKELYQKIPDESKNLLQTLQEKIQHLEKLEVSSEKKDRSFLGKNFLSKNFF